jgi:hypothetical protein
MEFRRVATEFDRNGAGTWWTGRYRVRPHNKDCRLGALRLGISSVKELFSVFSGEKISL